MSSLYAVISAEHFLYPELTLEENAAAVLKDEPTAYYSDDRGLMTARSSWGNPEALFVWFQPRTVRGGHTIKQRGGFVVAALGMVWADYAAFHTDTGKSNEGSASIMFVDGVGQTSKAPAKVIAFEHHFATICSADLRAPYDTEDRGLLLSHNSRRLRRGVPRWMDVPISFYPNWYYGDERGAPDPIMEIPVHAADGGELDVMLTATRTVAVARGHTDETKSYVLMVDEFEKNDTASHFYAWQMALPGAINPFNYWQTAPVHHCPDLDTASRIFFSETVGCVGIVGERRLLVQVIDSAPGFVFKVGPDCAHTVGDDCGAGDHLVIGVEAKRQHLKLLLWPHRYGAKLPNVSVTGPAGSVSDIIVKWTGQTDHWTVKNADSAAGLRVVREELALTPDQATVLLDMFSDAQNLSDSIPDMAAISRLWDPLLESHMNWLVGLGCTGTEVVVADVRSFDGETHGCAKHCATQALLHPSANCCELLGSRCGLYVGHGMQKRTSELGQLSSALVNPSLAPTTSVEPTFGSTTDDAILGSLFSSPALPMTTAGAAATKASRDDESKTLPASAIAGIVVAVFLVIAVGVGVLVMYFRQGQYRQSKGIDQQHRSVSACANIHKQCISQPCCGIISHIIFISRILKFESTVRSSRSYRRVMGWRKHGGTGYVVRSGMP